MASDEYFYLPELIKLSDFGGDPIRYYEAVYKCFKQDFVYNHPTFRGIRVGLKRLPMSQGKEATFWHMTSKGEDEHSREPDMRRMERIKWPATMINQSEHPYLKVWENTRRNKSNILIYHEKEEYLVVLRKVRDYVLPWTAYLVTYTTQKEKLLREYQNYIKSKERLSTAPVSPSTHG